MLLIRSDAYSVMIHRDSKYNPRSLLTAGLKGIGIATASAILAAAYPDYAPYMAEECMVSTPDVEAEDYTLAEYLKYADHYQKFAKKLVEQDPAGEWTPHKVRMIFT